MNAYLIKLAWLAVTVFYIAGPAFASEKKTYHSYKEFYQDVLGPTAKIQALKQGFDPIFIEGEEQRCFKLDHGKNLIEYCADKNGAFEISKQRFSIGKYRVKWLDKPLPKPEISTASASEIYLGKQHFICAEMNYEGIGMSGTFQRYRLTFIFNVTKPNRVTSYAAPGLFASCNAFGDANGDEKLDFVLVKRAKNHDGDYEAWLYTLTPDGFTQKIRKTPIRLKPSNPDNPYEFSLDERIGVRTKE